VLYDRKKAQPKKSKQLETSLQDFMKTGAAFVGAGEKSGGLIFQLQNPSVFRELYG